MGNNDGSSYTTMVKEDRFDSEMAVLSGKRKW